LSTLNDTALQGADADIATECKLGGADRARARSSIWHVGLRAATWLHEKLVSQGAAGNALLLAAQWLRSMQALVAGLTGITQATSAAGAAWHQK
jgi:hypothetical protein